MLNWKQLVRETNEQLAARDIADVNLACAEGLPGSEKIDHLGCIGRLNHYARAVVPYTERQMPAFHARRAFYDNSESKFRIVCMVNVLKKFGIRYNPAKLPVDVPLDTADTFIHGALMGDGGTCCSLPVVYTAVGRRLGYPLKLVHCHRHQFVRWEDPGGERFNIEVNQTGTGAPPDDHYRQGNFAVPAEQEKDFCHMVTHTPRIELASFLCARGYLWVQSKDYRESAASFLWAFGLQPENKHYGYWAKNSLDLWKKKLDELMPPNNPRVGVIFPLERWFPDTVPILAERWFLFYDALEKFLLHPQHEKEWWGPLRRGGRCPQMPTEVQITYTSKPQED